MSLINDALKKAQKRQAPGAAAPLPPPTPGGGAPSRPPGRGSPFSGQLLLLCALGAAVLVALSVVATVYLLRRPAVPGPVAQTAAPSTAVTERVTPSAAIRNSRPAATPPVVNQPPPPAPVVAVPVAPPATVPSPSASAAAAPAAAPPPAVVPSPVVPAAPPLDPNKPDPKIAAYIDALQVAGVRITSSGGKVLMNDRVYRQNDLVDRLLGVRLKKIEDDTLIFVDERGVIYTKNF